MGMGHAAAYADVIDAKELKSHYPLEYKAFEEAVGPAFERLNKIISNKMFYAILGTSPLLMHMFLPDDISGTAHASILGGLVRGVKMLKSGVPENQAMLQVRK